jgi:hypothetical protein
VTSRYPDLLCETIAPSEQPFVMLKLAHPDPERVSMIVYCNHDGSADIEINGHSLFDDLIAPSATDLASNVIPEILRFAVDGYVEVREVWWLGSLSPSVLGSDDPSSPSIASALSRPWARRTFTLKPWTPDD